MADICSRGRLGKPTYFTNIVSGARQSVELPFDTQPNEIELPCEIIEAPETLCACDSEASTDLSSLKGVQTNHLYEHLNSSLGAVFIGKEKPGAVSAQEEAE